MKARKFLGTSAREVMKRVRDEMGPDAIILSNKTAPEGIEIMAMSGSDMDALIAHEAGSPAVAEPADMAATSGVSRVRDSEDALPSPAVRAPMPSKAPAAIASAPREQAFRDFVLRSNGASPAAAGKPPEVASPFVKAKTSPFPTLPAQTRVESEKEDAAGLMAELREMKGLLAQQFDSLSWNESIRRRPLRGVLLRELLAAGFGSKIARSVTERLPDDFSEAQSRQWMLEVLGRNLQCQGEPDIVERGGVYALVGPTGVGKTTTAAKLAARCVMKFGAQRLGLITTDNYRIGAHDQLRIYGKILGVPVFVAQDTTELEHAIAAYAGKHLVLIDTIGMGQRDTRLSEQHTLLSVQGIQRLLLLNATSQTETLDDVVRAYGGGDKNLCGAVLTKIDEAIKLGGVLDVALRNRLRLHYVSNGQRVPEDLHPANGKVLAHRAMKAHEGVSARIESAGLNLALDAAGVGNV
jgi:flagellar biosynthesis protein FlhF